MQWRKPSAELVDRLHEAIPDDPAIDLKPMFGAPCYWVRGNMFAAVHQESIVVRLGDADRARLLALPGAALFEPSPGRAMKEYVAVPDDVASDPDELRRWLTLGFAYAASLPEKVKKARRTGRQAAGA